MLKKYPVLNAQIALSGMTRSRLAEAVGMHYNTLCRKLRGETGFTIDEAIMIRKALASSLPVEELFKE